MVPRRQAIDPPSYQYLRRAYRGRALNAPRSLRWIVIGVALLLFALHFVAGDRGLLRRMALEKEVSTLQEANAELILRKERLQREVQLKENDPMSLERLAREKYWMVGPGDRVYRFQEDGVAEPGDAPKTAPDSNP